MVLVAMAGAVTALGDTLFPVQIMEDASIFSQLQGELDPASHFLVRLRVVHPFLAMFFGAIVIVVGALIYGEAVESNPLVARLGKLFTGVCVLEVLIGILNIWLAAPGYMQLIHLLFAQILWTIWVLLFFSTREPSVIKISTG